MSIVAQRRLRSAKAPRSRDVLVALVSRPLLRSSRNSVEDILRRLGSVESHVSDLRSQVSAIPYLATKADSRNQTLSASNARINSARSASFKAGLNCRTGANTSSVSK